MERPENPEGANRFEKKRQELGARLSALHEEWEEMTNARSRLTEDEAGRKLLSPEEKEKLKEFVNRHTQEVKKVLAESVELLSEDQAAHWEEKSRKGLGSDFLAPAKDWVAPIDEIYGVKLEWWGGGNFPLDGYAGPITKCDEWFGASLVNLEADALLRKIFAAAEESGRTDAGFFKIHPYDTDPTAKGRLDKLKFDDIIPTKMESDTVKTLGEKLLGR